MVGWPLRQGSRSRIGTKFRPREQVGQHRSIIMQESRGREKGSNRYVRPHSHRYEKLTGLTKEQVESNRGEELLLVPSDSPPGLTQTMESMNEEPVLVVGRVPNPAFLMLHQSPHWLRRFC